MDTFFTTSLGTYTLPNRCQILSELGYDGTHLTIWDAHTAATRYKSRRKIKRATQHKTQKPKALQTHANNTRKI
jgi:sugar phosphate isomerase/epimerase